ncbi:MAG: hypothetical protein VYD64_05635, partial [Pseudomonadota bacterium]|nr:hypothetical protein [Pseudomonadota bacterium]
KIVDQFDKLAPGRGGALPRWLPALRFAPRHLVARYWPRPASVRAYARQKWPGTSLSQVRVALAVLSEGAGLRNAILADEVFPQLYHLRRTAGRRAGP